MNYVDTSAFAQYGSETAATPRHGRVRQERGQQLKLGAESVSLPLWFAYCLMRCEPLPTPHQAMKASDDPNYKASDAPRKNPQQNEWNQQEAPPCYPKYPVATAEHRAKHSRKTDTVASVGMITRILLCNVSIHVKPRRVA